MEKLRIILSTMALGLVAATPAFAAAPTRVYSSGILVLVFLGFCALVVVAQLIPAIITLVGMFKSSTANVRTRQAARVRSNS